MGLCDVLDLLDRQLNNLRFIVEDRKKVIELLSPPDLQRKIVNLK